LPRAPSSLQLLRADHIDFAAGALTVPTQGFQASLPFVLRWEGGFVDHPADPGGRTNKGVTQRTYDAWRRRQGLAPRDVVRIEDDEVQRIYESGYWLPPRCDLLARQLDLAQFDTAVNMGPGRAVRLLQAAVGAPIDGDFGPETERRVAAGDVGETLLRYCAAREDYYRGLVQRRPELGVFLKGWLNRLDALRREVGLPGFESARDVDPGDAGRSARIPDVGVDPSYDF
jgi:lysozyme family protein